MRRNIVCFAGCDWWYHNRGLFCPQIMSRLPQKGYRVLFVNSLGMRIPSFRKDKDAAKKIMRKLKSLFRYVRKAAPGMYVMSPLSIPASNPFFHRLNSFFVYFQIYAAMVLLRMKSPVFYIGCPPAMEVLKRFRKKILIYERTDLFEEMPEANKAHIAALDDTICRNSDLVLYVNTALWKEGLKKNKNSLLIGHGVDYDLFAQAHLDKEIPEDLRRIPRPYIGFFGDISAKTMDLSLLEYAAGKLPEMSFVMIGPVSAAIRSLSLLKNVYFLGQKPYLQIPSYGKEFNVAIMPWAQNRWIEFCNPVKAKEYLALGNPIVTTYYPEVEPYKDVVYVARTPSEFVEAILAAVHEKDLAKVQQRRMKVVNEAWDNKVNMISTFIEHEKTG